MLPNASASIHHRLVSAAAATSSAVGQASGWAQLVALTTKHSDQESVVGPAMSIFEVQL